MRPLAAVNDEFQGMQWNLFNDFSGLRVPAAWDRSIGAGQTIAILDTGITAHSDLRGNVLPGYDFVADPKIAVDNNARDADPSDPGDACRNPELGEPTESRYRRCAHLGNRRRSQRRTRQSHSCADYQPESRQRGRLQPHPPERHRPRCTAVIFGHCSGRQRVPARSECDAAQL